MVKHAPHYWLLFAEGHLTQQLFANMLGRTDGLPLPSGQPSLLVPKKTITMFPMNGKLSEETGPGSPGNEFSGTMEELLATGVTSWRKIVLSCTQVGICFQ